MFFLHRRLTFFWLFVKCWGESDLNRTFFLGLSITEQTHPGRRLQDLNLCIAREKTFVLAGFLRRKNFRHQSFVFS